MSEFTINQMKGFTLTFNNGITISIQFGPWNYCDGYENLSKANKKQIKYSKLSANDYWSSPDAEIAAWTKEGNWYDFDNECFNDKSSDVNGYMTVDEVADYITKFKNMTKNELELTKVLYD